MVTKLQFLSVCFLLYLANVHAEKLTSAAVFTADGQHDYTMYKTGKMYFSDNNLVIDTIGNGPSDAIRLTSIEKVLFSSFEKRDDSTESAVASAESLSVYPAKVEESLFVKGVSGKFVYCIYSATGNPVLKGEGYSSMPVNVAYLSAGVYFLQINGSILKFVKL